MGTAYTHETFNDWKPASPGRWIFFCFPVLAIILLIAAILRLYHLGQSSLWYDEVVTMRLAQTHDPTALVKLLRQIDATRALLHPLLLQFWVSLFGISDLSGRSLSALFGILTIAITYWVGQQAFDVKSGLWAAWLSAISPLLIYYSREARMYALLVLITCFGWGLLFSHGRSPKRWKCALYGLLLVAIAYSHPLGLLMVCTLGLASLLNRQAFQFSWKKWQVIHLTVAMAVTPWVGQYLNHTPESTSGLLSLRFLFGMPIAFIGGNFAILVVCLLLIVYGLVEFRRSENGNLHLHFEHLPSFISISLWLVVPPLVLYVYSRVGHPIFGPARYTLYVGPAYLILVSRGLAKLPWLAGIAMAGAGAVVSGTMLLTDVYRSDLKADWRGASAYLSRHDSSALVAVMAPTSSIDTELATARYYLVPPIRSVIAWSSQPSEFLRSKNSVWLAIGLRRGRPEVELPAILADDKFIGNVVEFSGLRLIRIGFNRMQSQRKSKDGRSEPSISARSEPTTNSSQIVR